MNCNEANIELCSACILMKHIKYNEYKLNKPRCYIEIYEDNIRCVINNGAIRETLYDFAKMTNITQAEGTPVSIYWIAALKYYHPEHYNKFEQMLLLK